MFDVMFAFYLFSISRVAQFFFSIDGNFGLCRKKSSGNSVRPPLNQQTFFCQQEEVDNYVSTYGTMNVSVNKVNKCVFVLLFLRSRFVILTIVSLFANCRYAISFLQVMYFDQKIDIEASMRPV